MTETFYQLAGLAVSAFMSATILPGSSEVVMIGLLTLGTVGVYEVLLVATLANTAGSMVNWAIGYFLAHYRHHPRFPLSEANFEKYSAWFNRYGIFALFLSWVPLAGDALTIIAGLMRANVVLVAIIVFLAKGARYLVVASATVAIF